MKRTLTLISALILSLGCLMQPLHAEEQTGTYRIVGLAAPELDEDLREVMKDLPGVQLASLDSKKAEATFRYEVTALFPGFNPKRPPTGTEILKRLDEKLRQASRGGFRVKPRCEVPADKLQRVEIKILIPDCKGCLLGTYNAVAKLDGVEQASVAKDVGQLTVTIDSSKTTREALINALKKAGVGFPAE